MHFKIYRDAKDEYRWTLYANNNEEIAVSSESYATLGGCEHSIELVKTHAKSAEVTGLGYIPPLPRMPKLP